MRTTLRSWIARMLLFASVMFLLLSYAPQGEPANSLFESPGPRRGDDPEAKPEKGTIPKPIELWAKDVPGATGDSDEDKPAVYPYLPPPDKNTGAAVLICPGGGFNTRCTDYEGVLIAQWLKSRGIAGFVLRYRIRPLYTMSESILDAHRAVQYLRAHADEYRIATDRIGIIGFSAGAELAAAATFNPLPGKADAMDPVERFPSRVNFMILAYGSARLRGPEVGKDALAAGKPAPPPTFLFCTAEDTGHLTGMIDLYAELRRLRVPVEVHFFERGEHGVGFAQGDPVLGNWPGLMYSWIRAHGFLTGQKRLAIKGVVKVDGEPLAHGSVTFTPIDAIGAPPVTAYVLNTGPVRGQYSVPADRGPTSGRYRVEVRQDATRWLSNSRDPVMQKMNEKQRSGTLTDQDRKEWHEYARKKSLSPSIEDLRIFRTVRPNDQQDLIIEIKAAGENQFDIAVFSK
jgi:acetyl esterase/lipase